MIKRAVHTFTGGPAAPVENPGVDPDMDPLYAPLFDQEAPDTQPSEDGSSDSQDDRFNSLQATVDGLAKTVSTQLSDKDREITRLRGVTQTYERQLATQSPAGGPPVTEPAPVLDQDTADLIAGKYKDDPSKAMIAVAEHLENRRHNEEDERDQVALRSEQIRAAERNVMRQVDLAIEDLGEEARELVGDFHSLYQQGAASESFQETWLGQEIIKDNTLAVSPSAVYRLVQLEVLNSQRNINVETHEPVAQQPTGIMRPAAPQRAITSPNAGDPNELSIEDQIGDAIVRSARGDDASARALLMGD